MTTKNTLSIFVAFTFLTACAGGPPRQDFKEGQRVQVIAFTNDANIYAQDDVILREETLNEKLAAMKPAWKEKLSDFSDYERYRNYSFSGQLLTLIIAAFNTGLPAIGWLTGSVIFGSLTIRNQRKAKPLQEDVVKEYNQSLSKAL